jgi:Flp pilus assembly protein TadD
MHPSMKSPLAIFALLLLSTGCQSSQTVTAEPPPAGDTALARRLNDDAFEMIRRGKHADAVPLLRRAIEADVTYGPARNNLGLVYYHQDQLYPAAREFDNAVKLMPYQPEPRNNLGMVFERVGKTQAAIDEYARARKLEPDNPQFIGNLARAKIRRGDRDDETRALLEELVFKDTRPEWRDWAKDQLSRLNARPIDLGPTTLPSR